MFIRNWLLLPILLVCSSQICPTPPAPLSPPAPPSSAEAARSGERSPLGDLGDRTGGSGAQWTWTRSKKQFPVSFQIQTGIIIYAPERDELVEQRRASNDALAGRWTVCADEGGGGEDDDEEEDEVLVVEAQCHGWRLPYGKCPILFPILWKEDLQWFCKCCCVCAWICFIIFLFCSSFASYIAARGVSLDWLTKENRGK